MKFWLGLGIGVAVGATTTYLALTRPWARAVKPAPAIAVAAAPLDAGVAPKKGRGKHTTRTTTAAGTIEREVDDEVVLTDGDRALEWRGDAVALPPRTVDMAGGGGDGRPLDDGEIQGAVAGGSGAIIDCIKAAVGGAPLAGAVTLSMLVGADGGVAKVRVRAAHYLHEHGLLACARRAARALPFPATGAPTVVTVPYELN